VQRADLLIERADVIATCAGPAPRTGSGQREITPLYRSAIAAYQGRIVYVGPEATLRDAVRVDDTATRIDARGCTVLPGFVDAHTHVLYAGDRRDELQRRLAGATYADIAANGGGIARTVHTTRAASEEELVASASVRLDEMARCGTTTCEIKSGYGLTLESELRQLRAIATLSATHPVDVVATFLGAHDIPPEHRSNPEEYVALVVERMIPAVAAESLAEWCDVFCETGAFTPHQSERILRAGVRAGLKPRIHADEFGPGGGAHVAARVGARAADHLVFVDDDAAEALARARVCAVLLPTAALYLKLGRYAPARTLIERGVPVAVGTDLNPGAGLSPAIPFAMTLACFAMAMTLEEALIAATLNAAWSLDRADIVGSLEPGKLMDAILVEGDLTSLLRVGVPPIRAVIKRGQVIVSTPSWELGIGSRELA
jgi:imidazolonepropionase